MQYAIFPMKILRFSAIWNTSTPHKKCSGTGYRKTNYKDYPTDLVGEDTGKDWFYAPCDLICLKVYNKASHGLWFRSKDKVQMPYGTGYLYMMAEHESVSGFRVGKVYTKGTRLFTEGRAGNATGNHIHLSCGFSKGKMPLGSGWVRNNHGAWVLHVKGVKNIKINQAFYLDESFTKSVRDKRMKFKSLPKNKAEKKAKKQGKVVKNMHRYTTGATYTLVDNMNIRISPKIDAPRIGVNKWSEDAKKHATKNGELKKGTKITIKDCLKDNNGRIWVKTPSGWICGVGADGKVFIN